MKSEEDSRDSDTDSHQPHVILLRLLESFLVNLVFINENNVWVIHNLRQVKRKARESYFLCMSASLKGKPIQHTEQFMDNKGSMPLAGPSSEGGRRENWAMMPRTVRGLVRHGARRSHCVEVRDMLRQALTHLMRGKMQSKTPCFHPTVEPCES